MSEKYYFRSTRYRDPLWIRCFCLLLREQLLWLVNKHPPMSLCWLKYGEVLPSRPGQHSCDCSNSASCPFQKRKWNINRVTSWSWDSKPKLQNCSYLNIHLHIEFLRPWHCSLAARRAATFKRLHSPEVSRAAVLAFALQWESGMHSSEKWHTHLHVWWSCECCFGNALCLLMCPFHAPHEQIQQLFSGRDCDMHHVKLCNIT